MDTLEHLKDDRYLVGFNIDGVSWMYEGTFDEEALRMHLHTVVVGEAPLDQGVLDSIHYDRERTGTFCPSPRRHRPPRFTRSGGEARSGGPTHP